MHQPRSARSVRAMKLGALALLLLSASLITTISLLSYAVYSDQRQLAVTALACAGLTLLLFLFYKFFSSAAHCPLCRGPILSGSGAQRNRNARRVFGSHRLQVAFRILFTNTFNCPYCNEPTRCRVKERPRVAR